MLRDWSLITGIGAPKRECWALKVLLLQKCVGDGKRFSHAERGGVGRKSFGVVFMQYLKVLGILIGGGVQKVSIL